MNIAETKLAPSNGRAGGVGCASFALVFSVGADLPFLPQPIALVTFPKIDLNKLWLVITIFLFSLMK